MVPLTFPVNLTDWGFIPGPELMDEPFDSTELQDISEHSPESIAATLLAFPGTKLVHSAEPSWYDWRAEWQFHERCIALDMTVFDDEEGGWGGSGIEAKCLAGDIIRLWSFLQTKHSGIWLHAPDCTMHTQQSFLEEIATYRDRM